MNRCKFYRKIDDKTIGVMVIVVGQRHPSVIARGRKARKYPTVYEARVHAAHRGYSPNRPAIMNNRQLRARMNIVPVKA
jgi:hypothetical protein